MDKERKVDPNVLYDSQFVKKHLDSQVAKVLIELGYDEWRLLSFVKLILSLVGIVAAVCSHFVLKDFKTQRLEMMGLVAIWIVCYGLIILVDAVYGAGLSGACHLGFPPYDSSTKRQKPRFVCALTSLGRYSATYALTLKSSIGSECTVTEKLEYNDFFTADGIFQADAFRERVKSALLQLEGRFDTVKKAQ